MIMQLEHISKSFGGRQLFHDVTFRLEEYERLALVGPNGAGKTTMLNIISGAEDPDEGRVLFAKGARVGYLEQEAIEMADQPIFEEVMSSQVEVLEAERRLHKLEAELGSGVTLYVGVEGGYGTTVVPRLVGFPLKEAKGRLWELGLNVGKVDFDEGINLLNQKDARVYIQHPTAERSAGLGSRVDLRLTLDEKKLAQHRAIAEKQAKEAAEERLQSEREHADSLAQAEFERAAAGTAEEQPADEPAAAGNDEGFFD